MIDKKNKKRTPTFEERVDIITHHWPSPLRVVLIATKSFLYYHGTIRAAAMTYTSFLAVIPLLILLTAITLALGLGTFFSDYLPVLNGLFSLNLPLDRIMPLLQNAETISLSNLGLIGSISVFVTFILAIGNLETNMNVVWENKVSRSIPKQLIAYTPLLLLGAGGIGLFAKFVSQFKETLLQIAIGGHGLPVNYVGTVIEAFWVIALNVVIIPLLFAAIYLLPFRRVDDISYKKLFLPSIGVSIAVWAANYTYLLILVKLQTNLFTRMSLFYGSLAFIPLVLLFVFGFWAIVLYGNCLVWTIYNWPNVAKKHWNWVGTKGNL